MIWYRVGDKPLPEPMLTQFIDVYMHRLAQRIWVDIRRYRHIWFDYYIKSSRREEFNLTIYMVNRLDIFTCISDQILRRCGYINA